MKSITILAAMIAALALIVSGCGEDDPKPSAPESNSTGGAAAYREAAEKANQELSRGPSLSDATSEADIKALAEYQRDSYSAAASLLGDAEPPADAKAIHDELTARLEKDRGTIEQLLDSGAGKNKLYEAVTASRRDVLPQIDELAATASRLEIAESK